MLTAGENWPAGTAPWRNAYGPCFHGHGPCCHCLGNGLVTLFLFIWLISAIRGRKDRTPLEVFDRVLMVVMIMGCMASIYTLSQVDGNYFILFYSLLVVISMRMGGSVLSSGCLGAVPARAHALGRGLGLGVICFMIANIPLTCLTSWAGQPGFHPGTLKAFGILRPPAGGTAARFGNRVPEPYIRLFPGYKGAGIREPPGCAGHALQCTELLRCHWQPGAMYFW